MRRLYRSWASQRQRGIGNSGLAYLLYTSPTSGTASLDRIVRVIAGPSIPVVRVAHPPLLDRPAAEGDHATFLDADRDVIYWFQGPRHWRPEIDLARFKVIVNFRDPRDLACNQYWWALQHPNERDSPEEAARKRKRVEAGGIERYVLGRDTFETYAPMLQISDGPFGDQAAYTSYAQLCCAFDLLIDNLCRAFGRSQRAVSQRLDIERPENRGANRHWVKVGGAWQGSDVSPGRFRREISPAGAATLTEKWERELAFCARRDAPFLAWHYG